MLLLRFLTDAAAFVLLLLMRSALCFVSHDCVVLSRQHARAAPAQIKTHAHEHAIITHTRSHMHMRSRLHVWCDVEFCAPRPSPPVLRLTRVGLCVVTERKL